MRLPANERGAALLTILLLVSVLAVIAATTLDRVSLSTKLAQNSHMITQARAFSYVAEAIAAARIEDLLARSSSQTTTEGNWLGREQRLPTPVGVLTARIEDGGNCFNLNSLVTEQDRALTASAAGQEQFINLMVALGLNQANAQAVAASAADWADTDNMPIAGGAEDADYRGATAAYLPANRMFSDASELRAVKGVTPGIYARLRDWVCALPVAQLSPINVNTLKPEQSPLLVMLFPQGSMSPATVRTYLANRPSRGYGSLIRFWGNINLQAAKPSEMAQNQVKLTSSWFMLHSRVQMGELRLDGRALITADRPPARVIWRSWGENQ